jgi:VWFA-related protein
MKRVPLRALRIVVPLALAILTTRLPVRAQSAGQTPTLMFRSSVDIVAVDVQVVGREGVPVLGLGIDDFAVTVNGHPRRIVSVDFIKKDPLPPPEGGGPDLPIRTPGYLPPGTRVFVLAVDTSSFTTSNVRPAVQAAQRFVAQLQPDDVVALYVFPFEEPVLDVTHDHRLVSRALERVTGDYQPFTGMFDLTLDEVIDITANDSTVLARVAARECEAVDSTCRPSIQGEASTEAAYYESQAMQGLKGLSLLLKGLATLSGRKTVMLLSGGMLSSDRVGSRPDLSGSMTRVGAEAAAANTSLYVLHFDDSFADAFSATSRTVRDPARRITELGRTTNALRTGLERLSDAAGGALLRIEAGTGDGAFTRVLRESIAYYLIGVQPTETDRDGQLHFLHVKVKKRGVTVRSRTHVVIPVK